VIGRWIGRRSVGGVWGLTLSSATQLFPVAASGWTSNWSPRGICSSAVSVSINSAVRSDSGLDSPATSAVVDRDEAPLVGTS